MTRILRRHARFLSLAGSFGLLVGLMLLALPGVLAHGTSAYSHDSSTGSTHVSWMAGLPDQMPISQISIPGTHDTGAFVFGGDLVETQTMDPFEQLNAGIRAWDIRLGISGPICVDESEIWKLWVHHGPLCQFIRFDTGVLRVAQLFLQANPSETILMRIKQDAGLKSIFPSQVQANMDLFPGLFYTGSSDNPTLGEVRGKVVILQQFEGDDLGIPWDSINLQDLWNLGSKKDIGLKWPAVRDHLGSSDTGDMHKIYGSFLSAAGTFPYFFASGHLSPQTGAARQIGWLEGVGGNCSGDARCLGADVFPRVNCTVTLCSVLFEGINVLTRNYINSSITRRAGIVYADFPGAGLIEAIIDLNPWNLPPVPDAGGPYSVPENSPVVFDASGSTDPDLDSLSYRWDWVGDGSWVPATGWSVSATEANTWQDDTSGTVHLEVYDQYMISTTSTTFTVYNVAPVAAIDSLIDETGAEVETGIRPVLTNVPIELFASFTDVGPLDTHTAVIEWGDGATDPLPGAVWDVFSSGFTMVHAYPSPGVFIVRVEVTDDDGGVDVVTRSVTVLDATMAVAATTEQLLLLVADPALDPAVAAALQQAIDGLIGQNGGVGANGALDLLEKDNLVAALGMIVAAIADLEATEAAGGPDLTAEKSLFVLVAKSVAVGAVQDAAATAVRPIELAKIADAQLLIDEASVLLAVQSYVDAASNCRLAVLKVVGLLR